MKKICFLALLAFTFIGLHAQQQSGYYPIYSIHDPHFGLTFGPQATSFYSDPYDSEFQFGFFIGGSFSLPLSNRIGLEPQILYTRKGGKGDFYINDFYDGTIRFKLHYIETPLLVNIHTKNVVDIVLGGYAGFLLDSNFDYGTPYYYGYGEQDNDQFEKIDLGLVAGIGINLPNGKILLKYNHGLTDVAKEGNAYLFLEGAKNHGFSFSYIGYLR